MNASIPPISFSFDLDVADMMAFQRFHLYKQGQLKWIVIILRLAIPLFLILKAANDLQENSSASAGAKVIPILLILLGIAWLLFLPKLIDLLLHRGLKRSLKKRGNEQLLGARNMMFTEEQLQIIGPEYQYTYAWEAIRTLGKEKDYYFLYDSALTALVVPKKKVGAQLRELDSLLAEKFDGQEPSSPRAESLEDLLAESRDQAKYQKFNKRNKILWMVAGLIALLNIVGVMNVSPTMTDIFPRDLTFALKFSLVNLGLFSVFVAYLASLIPSKSFTLIQRLHRRFLVCYILFAGLTALFFILDFIFTR